MIVVITIIGILAGVVVVNYPRFIGEANIAAAKMDIKTIKENVNTFRWKYHRYPETLDELMNPPDLPGQPPPEPFLNEAPIDPWGREYYFSIEDGKPVVICFGEDGQEGTEDDITDQKGADEGGF